MSFLLPGEAVEQEAEALVRASLFWAGESGCCVPDFLGGIVWSHEGGSSALPLLSIHELCSQCSEFTHLQLSIWI